MKVLLNYENFSKEVEITQSDVIKYLSAKKECNEVINFLINNKDFIEWLKMNHNESLNKKYEQMSFFSDSDF